MLVPMYFIPANTTAFLMQTSYIVTTPERWQPQFSSSTNRTDSSKFTNSSSKSSPSASLLYSGYANGCFSMYIFIEVSFVSYSFENIAIHFILRLIIHFIKLQFLTNPKCCHGCCTVGFKEYRKVPDQNNYRR